MGNSKKILITAALPYVNNAPHLGNIIGCVLSADVYSRFTKNNKMDSVYICGTDEYGTATETEAKKLNISPIDLCDRNHEIHRKVYDWFDIKFDYFGRTSAEEHKKTVQMVFMQNYLNGNFMRKSMEQFYCGACSMFLADRFVKGACRHCGHADIDGDQCDACGKLCTPEELVDPYCATCRGSPTRKTTEHLFLDLHKFREKLCEIPTANFSGIAARITRDWLRKGLEPRCMTRDLKWGVPVPEIAGSLEDFGSKIFYVWFDAPIGYMTFTKQHLQHLDPFTKKGEWEVVQFMGKDNVPFHTIIFPAVQLGTGTYTNVVSRLSSTEYLNFDGQKFSKSRGVGIFGTDLLGGEYGDCSVWRYCLLKLRPESSDSNFTLDGFRHTNNTLLNTFGNLCNRVLKFLLKNCGGAVSYREREEDREFIAENDRLFREYRRLMENIEIKKSVDVFEKICALANRRLQESFDPQNKESKLATFHLSYSVIRNLAKVVEPLMPKIFSKLESFIGEIANKEINGFEIFNEGKVYKVENLFTKFGEKDEEAFKKFGFKTT